MQLFCPACQSAFTGVSRCPRCGGLLLMPEEAAFLVPDPEATPSQTEKPTAAGGFAVGTVAALGAYLALRQFLSAWVAAAAEPGWWASDEASSVVMTVQAVSAVFGAVLAGAGRAGGFWPGAAVGGVTGGLLMAAEVAAGAPLGYLVLLAQPVVLLMLGGVAGAVSSRVWGGVPYLDMPSPAVRRSSSVQLGEVTPKPAGRPTSWARVVAGGLLMAAGVVAADPARRTVEKHSQGAVRSVSTGQARFLSSQLATVGVLVGAVVAAAGTGAGVRHGSLAGLVGAAGLAGMTLWRGVLPVPAGYLIEHMNLDPSEPGSPAVLVGVAVGLAVGGVVGGWLGGTLFPPLAPLHLRGRRVRLD